ncbi:MAG: hypothetical protein QOC81_2238 [Thermoanaerobaculia bacterium]|nr:hypothetical protein [Thermoanaerobaculia bacterium]
MPEPPNKDASRLQTVTPQQRAAKPAAVSKPAVAPKPQQDLGLAIRETAKDAIKEAAFSNRPYLKLAFNNPYNLSLLLGGLAASVLTLNPIPGVVALGAEALWLLHGSDSKYLRRILWDPRLEKIRLAFEEQDRAVKMKDLPDDEQQRVRGLVEREQQINKLAAQNPSFTGDLLRTELVKTHKLVESFLEMALTVNRYENYLDSVDVKALERDRERWHDRSIAQQASAPERDIALKNFAVIQKRVERVHEIGRYLGVTRAQLDLIENSFQLIADQIVTMQSPTELSGQLDDLLDGVDSIRQTAIDTEKLLSGLESSA